MSSQLLRLHNASVERLQHRNIGASLRLCDGEESCCSLVKHIMITVRLSKVLSLRASMTSSLAHCSGLSCRRRPLRTMLTACWLDMTSQIPSHPMIRNSSSSVSNCCLNSGSAMSGEGVPGGSFKSQSPRARLTERTPFRYPSSM